eukprot:353281-Prymnesium_polylepis.1
MRGRAESVRSFDLASMNWQIIPIPSRSLSSFSAGEAGEGDDVDADDEYDDVCDAGATDEYRG